MTGERALGGRVAAGIRTVESVAVFGPVTSSSQGGWYPDSGVKHRLRRGAERPWPTFPRNTRMFVDYLVTGIPLVGYGDQYMGTGEGVSGARGRSSN